MRGRSRRSLTATLIDANNVRGTIKFPELSAFSSACNRWAQNSGGALQLIAIDHGESAEAFALSDEIAVAFAGERTDADTVIVHTVDWLLGAGFVTGQAINVDGGMTRKMIYEH